MSRVSLVTGALGFCGRHLLARLSREPGVEAVGVDLPCDLTAPGAWESLLATHRPERVYHLAGLAAGAPEPALYRVNFLATVALLEAVRAVSPETRVLLVGSAAEYGDVAGAEQPIRETLPCRPASAYGASKYAATLAALHAHRAYGLSVLVARPFNIVGSGMGPGLLGGALLARAKTAFAGEAPAVVSVGNLDASRDFIAVEDACDAYVRLLDRGAWGEVFHVCSGRPVVMRELVAGLLAHSARPIDLRFDPSLGHAASVPVSYGSPEKTERAIGPLAVTPLASSLEAAWRHVFGGAA